MRIFPDGSEGGDMAGFVKGLLHKLLKLTPRSKGHTAHFCLNLRIQQPLLN